MPPARLSYGKCSTTGRPCSEFQPPIFPSKEATDMSSLKCAVCSAPSAKKCKDCQSIAYCGRECQVKVSTLCCSDAAVISVMADIDGDRRVISKERAAFIVVALVRGMFHHGMHSFVASVSSFLL